MTEEGRHARFWHGRTTDTAPETTKEQGYGASAHPERTEAPLYQDEITHKWF